MKCKENKKQHATKGKFNYETKNNPFLNIVKWPCKNSHISQCY